MSAQGPGAPPPLPPGVDWTPVDDVLAALEAAMRPAAAVERVALAEAADRILAEDAVAGRAHPAADNAAVDGFAFAHPGDGAAQADGTLRLRLRAGRAAAGAPWEGRLGPGEAARILTGAPMPDGSDTVALQEEARIEDGDWVRLRLPWPGANRRRRGENIAVGDVALRAGDRLSPQALAQAASAGLGAVAARAPLKVSVLSTGDEIAAADDAARLAPPWRVADANGPMLSALIARLGARPVAAGIAADAAASVAAALDRAAEAADAVVVSGGASGGEEDHVARLLADAAAQGPGAEGGGFHVWRVAMKPGRPFAAGLWRGRPVFALPGNPVAAFVCFLLFVRPSLLRLSGAAWPRPRPLWLPVGFAYNKRPGRREYLRVRVAPDGRLEKFRSEGSGLIEGLLWSDGLADLAHDAGPVAPGDPVAFLSFADLGAAP